MSVPKSHPRYESLMTRERLADAMKRGLVHTTGLIAHGRGEAFDYLLGEKTPEIVRKAETVSMAALLSASHPVISVNGNVVALAAEEVASLSKTFGIPVEVNLFHRTQERMGVLIGAMKDVGLDVLGGNPDTKIPGLEHDRGLCEMKGIGNADVVLVPLEDGDRCQALRSMGKTVIAIDLNPLSRTARMASITVVNELRRALPEMIAEGRQLKGLSQDELTGMVKTWDNEGHLVEVRNFLSKRLLEG